MTASGCKKRTDYLIDKCRKMLYTVQTTSDSSLIKEIKEKLLQLKMLAKTQGAKGLIVDGDLIKIEQIEKEVLGFGRCHRKRRSCSSKKPSKALL